MTQRIGPALPAATDTGRSILMRRRQSRPYFATPTDLVSRITTTFTSPG
jgi:hypothetical protein